MKVFYSYHYEIRVVLQSIIYSISDSLYDETIFNPFQKWKYVSIYEIAYIIIPMRSDRRNNMYVYILLILWQEIKYIFTYIMYVC